MYLIKVFLAVSRNTSIIPQSRRLKSTETLYPFTSYSPNTTYSVINSVDKVAALPGAKGRNQACRRIFGHGRLCVKLIYSFLGKLLSFPEVPRKEDKHGVQFKASAEHIEGEYPFRRWQLAGKVKYRSYRAKAWADIAEGCGNRAY